jgi:uncharacterized protein (TIGR02246 family)
MRNRILFGIATAIVCAGPAWADPASVVKAHTDAFAKAFAACDIPAVLNLYEDNATVIWPGDGEVASDKEAFAKIFKAECATTTNSSLKLISSDAHAIGKDYIINVGMWDYTTTGAEGKPTTSRLRTTELLHKSNGKWRYMVDNASFGVPPPPAKQ